MPIAQYFSGNGTKVMKSMKKTYGDNKKAKSAFYATANAHKKEEGENSPENKTAPKRKTLAQRIAGEFQSL